MNAANWFVIVAVLLGPAITLFVYRRMDQQRHVRDRQLSIFRALMATRSHTTSWHHIEALNRIDVEFNSSNTDEASVIDAWKRYLDVQSDSGLSADEWSKQRTDRLADLLEKMALVVRREFDRDHVIISTNVRTPVAAAKPDH